MDGKQLIRPAMLPFRTKPAPKRTVSLPELGEQYRALVEAASKAKENAYAPYSGFMVGAAVLTNRQGTLGLHAGSNLENASYGITICAERAAIVAAHAGGSIRNIVAIAISAIKTDGSHVAAPQSCGECRQVILEVAGLSNIDIEILSASTDLSVVNIIHISDALPDGFDARSLRPHE